MNININGAITDITLENEKTVGDIVAGISDWLAGSGFVIYALEIDNKDAGAMLDEAFKLKLEELNSINIKTRTQAELCVEALVEAKTLIEEGAFPKWQESASASFLRDIEPELYAAVEDIFTGKAENQLDAIIEEREQELRNPAHEFLKIETQVQDLIARLTDLALDIQMGKDRQAAQTVQIFAGLCAKIFRLIPLLRLSGIEFEKINLAPGFFEDLYSSFRDFLSAYEASDTVLSGDLAEYEIAPRLGELYSSLRNASSNYTGQQA